MRNISKQIRSLYLLGVFSKLSLTGAWVAILAARGYSLIEIGIAETVFHIASLLFEIPSGVLADVFGRKNMLIVSAIMRMVGNIIMVFSCNFFMICISLAFDALSYNFMSGSDDALAYDSLKMASKETYYEKYVSNQMIIYRICSAIATLSAGFALLIGYKLSYGINIIIAIVQLGILTTISEVRINKEVENTKRSIIGIIRKEIIDCFVMSISFLKNAKKAVLLMVCNSLVGAFDVLLLFFLQAKLKDAGMQNWKLGIGLFFMEMGGILGAKVILKCKNMRYRNIFIIATTLVLSGVLVEHSGKWFIMIIGGFIAALSDDALQIRTNALLQDMFPSEQRATLISIDSFIFSMLMIVLSPLAGWFYSWW